MKERDDEPLLPSQLPQRAGPHVLTRRGLRLMRERLLASPPDERAALEAFLREATPAPPPEDPARVALGATVTLRGIGTTERSFDIATEDEVDVENGRLGLESPLARAIFGKRVGDRARWQRPIGETEVEILRITYE